MSSHLEKAKKMGFNVDELVKALSSLDAFEEIRRYGIRAVRYDRCYCFWSSKGMMRLGLDLDRSAVAFTLINLSENVNLKRE